MNVVNLLRQLRPNWNFLSLIKRDTDPLDGHVQTRFNDLPIEHKHQATYKIMAELDVLTQAKYVVCTFSSNVCRLLQTLRHAHVDTVLSLDTKWIYD